MVQCPAVRPCRAPCCRKSPVPLSRPELISFAVERVDVQPQRTAVADGRHVIPMVCLDLQLLRHGLPIAALCVNEMHDEAGSRIDREGKPAANCFFWTVPPSRPMNTWGWSRSFTGLTEASMVHCAGVMLCTSIGDAWEKRELVYRLGMPWRRFFATELSSEPRFALPV